MSKLCMVVGCTEHATEAVVFDAFTEADVEVTTHVHICSKCDYRIHVYLIGEPFWFERTLIDNVSVTHDPPDAEGFAEAESVWFIPSETLEDDPLDALQKKERWFRTVYGASVDVQENS